jgi:hypothetical protein
LLQLHPGNRYRLLVARTFRWIPDRPITPLAERAMIDFFDHAFDASGELLPVLNVRGSDASRVALLSRLRQAVEADNEQRLADAGLPLAERPRSASGSPCARGSPGWSRRCDDRVQATRSEHACQVQ